MAEREGFEPSVPLRVQQISNLPLSATQSSLPIFSWTHNGAGTGGIQKLKTYIVSILFLLFKKTFRKQHIRGESNKRKH